uniref:XRE family transcriptional regulator n=1 Tax=Thermus caliditerrae TaxID=1330700 RepID=A0A7C5REV0_9DEIN
MLLTEVPELNPEKLKERRKALGLSASQLGSMIGAPPAWVLAVEKGEKALTHASYIRVQAYLQALGLLKN